MMGKIRNLKELKENSPELSVIIEKMLTLAGYDPEAFEFNDDWYHKNTITKAQEKEFKAWLKEYLTPRMQKKLYGHAVRVDEAIAWIVLEYGLRVVSRINKPRGV